MKSAVLVQKLTRCIPYEFVLPNDEASCDVHRTKNVVYHNFRDGHQQSGGVSRGMVYYTIWLLLPFVIFIYIFVSFKKLDRVTTLVADIPLLKLQI